MAESVGPDSTQDVHGPRGLWTFLTAISGVNDELERARLAATGLPSVLPCDVSGVALLLEPEGTWHLAFQQDGQQLESPVVDQVRADLEVLAQEAFRRPGPLAVTTGGQAGDCHVPPAIEKAGVQCLAVVPLMTVHHRLGILFAGRRHPDAFPQVDVAVLLTLAEHLATGIENLRLYRTLQQRSHDLEGLAAERTEELSKEKERHRDEIAALKSRVEQENRYLQEEIKTEHKFGDILGESAAIKNLLKAIETVAPTKINVVISGETGTGKELVARALHNLSPRKRKTLIKINCATLPKELFESEFFGHVRGTFTGALRDRVGRLELADKGTLFLDEVAEIPLDMQSKLLGVLQGEAFKRIGEERTRKADVRIIAATDRDLKQEVEAGRFRQDLYDLLNVFPIEVVPLRLREEDIPGLAAHYLQQAARTLPGPCPSLTQAGVQQLLNYDWPGNVRELQNVIERAVITSRSGPLHFDLPGARVGQPSATIQPVTPARGSSLTSRIKKFWLKRADQPKA